MGRRGPPVKPTATKKREGTYRADRAPKREPKAPKGSPTIPPTIARDKIARECWRRLVPVLLRMRVLTRADSVTLEGLCRSYSTAVRADDELLEKGMFIDTEYGRRASPAVSVGRHAWAEVRRFALEFGLSPAARTRVEAEADDSADTPDQVDAGEGFLFGGGQVVGSIGSR